MKKITGNFLQKFLSPLIAFKQRHILGHNKSLPQKIQPLSTEYGLDVGILSDIGCVRKRNEDSAIVVQLQTKSDTAPGLLAIVADGMGGHKAGNHASELAVSVIRERICATDSPSEDTLAKAFQAANEAIFHEAVQNSDYAGMGTTATVLLLFNGRGWLAHVGDSRLYRLRQNTLTQLSEDHTLVANMQRDGLITTEQARIHPDRNVLDRAMGTHQHLEIMLSPVELKLGDIFLLCSDGLHDLVNTDEIRDKLLHTSLQASCNLLVDLARRRGGFDNISVVLVCCDTISNLSSIPSTRDVIITSNA